MLKKINKSYDAVVFAVDLNKVLVKPDIKKMIWFSFTYLKVSSFLIIFNYNFWYYIVKNGAVPENIIDNLSFKYSKFGITKTFLIDLMNIQILNIDLINYLKTLKSQKFKIYIASNLWQLAFYDLLRKFKILESFFDGYYIPKAENHFIEKPDKRYFYDFKKYLNKKNETNKQVIFIDDKSENVIAANNQGFIGIQYINFNDLLKKLNNL